MHQRLGATLTKETRHQLSTSRGESRGGEYWARELHHLGYIPPQNVGYAHTSGARDAMGDQIAELGQYVAAAAALYSAYNKKKQGGGGAPSGGPAPTGATTGMQQPGSTATAISPTFQTQISPQISPTFQQTQSSPGSVQAATATQYMPGGMRAEGGSATPAAPASPYGPSFPDFGARAPTKAGGFPVSPLDPVQFTDIREFPTAGSLIRDIRESEPFNWTPVYWIGGAAVAGVIALALLRQKSVATKRKAA